MHYRGFGLAGKPSETQTVPIEPDDEIYNWLGRFCDWSVAETVPQGFSLDIYKVSKWPMVDSR